MTPTNPARSIELSLAFTFDQDAGFFDLIVDPVSQIVQRSNVLRLSGAARATRP
jgi:hypothetical protein